jgi:uncharacterized protein with ATP-grasp and redox domains
MNNDCYQCHHRNIIKLVDKHKADVGMKGEQIGYLTNILNRNRIQSNVFVSTIIHREARQLLCSDDFYLHEKDKANEILLKNYQHWQALVKQDSNPLYTAMKLSIIGNIIDYGAHSVPDDIEQYVNGKLSASITLDQSEELFKDIKNAKNILYLGDNCGELIFDKLFIENMNHPDITFTVRGMPIINDVTQREADITGIAQVAKVISNGFDAPSTLLEYCSQEFKEAFDSADLIISKGQGNLEGLLHYNDPRLYFLLTAKCHYIANILGVSKGDLVVTNASTIKRNQCLLK